MTEHESATEHEWRRVVDLAGSEAAAVPRRARPPSAPPARESFRVSGLPILDSVDVDYSLRALIPYRIARKFQVIPVERQGSNLVVAMPYMPDEDELEELRYFTKLEIQPRLVAEPEVKRAIARLYEVDDEGSGDDLPPPRRR